MTYYTNQVTPQSQPNTPQFGGLYVHMGEQQLVFPLKHTEVLAKVTGNVSRVEVTQKFENPFTTALEAVYVFPLPDEAAVDDMEIKIGDRIIKGNIKKREEAKAIYEQAKREGRTAGLLEQERDNIFTQSLANIKPGEQIDVTIRYTDSLKFEGGNYEFVFPMVVGPRYIPGTPIEGSGSGTAPAPMTLNQDTDQVPDASRLNAPILPPGTRSGHDIGVTVEIDAGVAIKDVRSPSHQLRIEHEGQIVRVKLGRKDTIPNKDLILRYQVSGDNTQATVLTQSDERGGHFAIYLIPALDYRTDEIVPKDVVFLVDASGSMGGDPLRKCQELMRRFINGLNPYDTFTILDFSNTVRQFSPTPLPNTPENRTQAIKYINNLRASGGTEMLSGIRAAINFPTPAGRLRSVVLLTDGYIGNDNEILAEVQKHLQPANRLYSFGVGSSVNRFLLNRVAEIGRGISQIVRQDEPTEEVAEKFFRQINNPVLTSIQITWDGSGESPIIYPSIAPDLFAEQPLVLFGRIAPPLPSRVRGEEGKLHISGIAAGGKRYEKTFHLNFEETKNPAIAQLWGRARIKDLMNQMVSYETKAGVEAVTETALNYQLLSQYTAFVAVSEEVRVDPEGKSVSMQVPVEMPEGVSYEGIFGQAAVEPQALQLQRLSASAPYQVRRDSVPAPEFIRQRLTRSVPPPPAASEMDLSAFGWAGNFSEEEFASVDDFNLSLIEPAIISSNAPAGSGGELRDILLLDVTPLSLGIEMFGGVMTRIIPRNTTIPTKKSAVFSTAIDGQTNVEIHILQGERMEAAGDKSLATICLEGISPAPRGVPEIEVIFEIDANGILRVTAKDKGTGQEQFITITNASTVDSYEVERRVKDAELNVAVDAKFFQKIERQNQASGLSHLALKALPEAKKLTAALPITLPSHLQLVSVTGLDQVAMNALIQHLQVLKLSPGFSGEMVFEFAVSKGRVQRIMLDEDASTLKEAMVVEMIKRSLTTWRPPQSATGTVRLTLQILP